MWKINLSALLRLIAICSVRNKTETEFLAIMVSDKLLLKIQNPRAEIKFFEFSLLLMVGKK